MIDCISRDAWSKSSQWTRLPYAACSCYFTGGCTMVCSCQLASQHSVSHLVSQSVNQLNSCHPSEYYTALVWHLLVAELYTVDQKLRIIFVKCWLLSDNLWSIRCSDIFGLKKIWWIIPFSSVQMCQHFITQNLNRIGYDRYHLGLQ